MFRVMQMHCLFKHQTHALDPDVAIRYMKT
jgi:hypothetical protein